MYALTRRAIKSVIGNQGPRKPTADESLEDNYGLDITARAALYDPINDTFMDDDTPIAPLLTPGETRNKKTLRELVNLIKNRVAIFVFILSGILVQLPTPSYANLHIQDINLDDNQEIVTFQERKRFFIYNQKISIRMYDTNENGKLDASELSKLNLDLQVNAEEELAIFSDDDATPDDASENILLDDVLVQLNQERRVPPTEEELEEQRIERKLEEQRDYTSNSLFYLRNRGADISIRAGRVTANAASISYQRDGNSDTESGRITAAIGFLNRRDLKSDSDLAPQDGTTAFLSAFAYSASVAIDRSFDSRGRNFETDTLTFRLGGDLEIADPDGLPLQYFSGNVRYETDTRFETGLFGIEAAYEPFSWFFRSSKPINDGNLTQRFTPTAQLDYGNVTSGRNNISYDSFFNLGYGLEYELAYRKDGKRLASLVSNYSHFWNVENSNVDSIEWDTQLQFPLGSNENINLLIEHSYEDNSVTNTEENEFSVGLGLKF